MKETPLICTYQNEVCYFFIVTKYYYLNEELEIIK